jgi:16S rRNA (cytosine967-C5)-methyltransferase
MIALARRAAYDALRAVATRTRDLGEVLADSRERLPDDRDRALTAAIVVGTLRWRNRLDWLLARAADRDVASLDPEVLDILRLSLFQLLDLTRVPAAAVVDDAVSLTKAARKKSAAGLTNAVLRKLARTRHQLGLPELPVPIDEAPREALLEYLTVSGSHPRWLVERWVDRLGAGAAARWIEFNNQEPPLTLRANTLRTTRDELAERLKTSGVETRATGYAPDGLVVLHGQPLRTADAGAGLFVVQDEASQLVPLLAGTSRRSIVLDACAAPGGKTLTLAAGVARDGVLVASDVSRRRVALLREILHRAGADRPHVIQADLERGAPFDAVFDLVLLDAPCTGLGTLRRDVDIRWRRSPDDVRRAAAKQGRMIETAGSLVAPAGRLIYATCSSEPEENERVVDGFLAARPDFVPVPAADLVADGVPPDLLDERGRLMTRPDRHGLEVFFGVALERRRG